MTTIYKYPLILEDRQVVLMPRAAQILSAQMQGRTLCLWALVDTAQDMKPRQIEILGTGTVSAPDKPTEERHFIATVQMGQFVWHLFEITPRN